MTLSEQITIKRWNIMANADLGCAVQPMAIMVRDLFEKAYNTIGTTVQITCPTELLKQLRGFAINLDLEDECVVAETLDLAMVTISKSALHEFDDYMMMDRGWADRYQYVLGI